MKRIKNKTTKPNKECHLIIGAGEIGRALYRVLQKAHNVSIRDKADEANGRFDVLHIAYSFIPGFVRATKTYIKKYKPKIVIIHSTIPVGTTKKVGKMAVHSPIRGAHPHLEKGIRTFVKYFGGAKSKIAERYFTKLKIPTRSFPNAETTELLKILDTAYYGWNIIFAKETKRLCEKFNVDFNDVYTDANKSYNAGYKKLGMSHVIRPLLKFAPGKIGGHCVIPNTKLLKDWLTDTLRNRNKRY